MSDDAGLPDWGSPHQDLGHGHTLRFVSEYGEPDGQWCGAIVAHSKPDGSTCVGGYISFEDSVKDNAATRAAGVLWKVESREPIIRPFLSRINAGDITAVDDINRAYSAAILELNEEHFRTCTG